MLEPLREPTVLTGDLTADHVVIGGGYSGLAVARRLAELDPSASIVLIEGDRIGNNAAGRSSGFAIDHAHNLRAKGFADAVAEAKADIALNRAGLEWLGATIAANDIDCQWVQEGKYHAAATDRGEGLGPPVYSTESARIMLSWQSGRPLSSAQALKAACARC